MVWQVWMLRAIYLQKKVYYNNVNAKFDVGTLSIKGRFDAWSKSCGEKDTECYYCCKDDCVNNNCYN